MDAKDLRTESVVSERSNNGSTKYTQSGAALQSDRNKSYQDIGSNSLGKVDVQATRPCAVIGPDRVVPPALPNDAYLKKASVEPWPCPDNTYRRPPEYPLKIADYQNQTRNISPRQTFQENMQRIMVPPRYSAEKPAEEPIFTQDKSVSHSKTVMLNVPPETKYCDVPYNINPVTNELKNIRNPEMCVPNMNSASRSSAPFGWPPSSANVRHPRPYGTSEMYQYPDYVNCGGPRPMLVSRPQRNIHEDPVFAEAYYQEGSIRYKPYPTTKERYSQPRYEYHLSNYSHPYQPPPFPHKPIPPHAYPTYSQMPPKYMDNRIPESVIDPYSRHANQPPNYNLPFRNQLLHSNYGQVPGNYVQNKLFPFPQDGSVKSVQPNKLPYENNKVYPDYDSGRAKNYPVPENYYVPEIGRPHQVKSQMMMQNFPSMNMHVLPPHAYYKKDSNEPLKPYDFNHPFRNYDHTMNIGNPLARIPSQFSPTTIGLSPSGSNNTNEHIHTMGHDDLNFPGHPALGNPRAMELGSHRIPYEYYKKYDSRYVPEIRAPKPQSNTKDKKGIDLRQYLQMWNEGDDENNDGNKNTDLNNVSNEKSDIPKHYENKNKSEDQLYVLGLVNVPSEELDKYEHIQKVSKLPENIKGYNSIELLNQFEEAIESSNMNSYNSKSAIQYPTKPAAVPSTPMPPRNVLPRPVSPLDVEAKISQSVIHKEVGCNFEIKPCSPKMLNVEVAAPMQTILGERVIEKVSNPIMKPPTPLQITETVDKPLKLQEHRPYDDELKAPSCKMINTQCSSNENIDPAKTNYTVQDLESNSGVCLASLPRLDNDIELSFPEVNQQFINANKTESVITFSKELPTLDTAQSEQTLPKDSVGDLQSPETFALSPKVDSPKEFTRLSKYRKLKTGNLEYQEHISDAEVQATRTDSVIIKNPENSKELCQIDAIEKNLEILNSHQETEIIKEEDRQNNSLDSSKDAKLDKIIDESESSDQNEDNSIEKMMHDIHHSPMDLTSQSEYRSCTEEIKSEIKNETKTDDNHCNDYIINESFVSSNKQITTDKINNIPIEFHGSYPKTHTPSYKRIEELNFVEETEMVARSNQEMDSSYRSKQIDSDEDQVSKPFCEDDVGSKIKPSLSPIDSTHCVNTAQLLLKHNERGIEADSLDDVAKPETDASDVPSITPFENQLDKATLVTELASIQTSNQKCDEINSPDYDKFKSETIEFTSLDDVAEQNNSLECNNISSPVPPIIPDLEIPDDPTYDNDDIDPVNMAESTLCTEVEKVMGDTNELNFKEMKMTDVQSEFMQIDRESSLQYTDVGNLGDLSPMSETSDSSSDDDIDSNIEDDSNTYEFDGENSKEKIFLDHMNQTPILEEEKLTKSCFIRKNLFCPFIQKLYFESGRLFIDPESTTIKDCETNTYPAPDNNIKINTDIHEKDSKMDIDSYEDMDEKSTTSNPPVDDSCSDKTENTQNIYSVTTGNIVETKEENKDFKIDNDEKIPKTIISDHHSEDSIDCFDSTMENTGFKDIKPVEIEIQAKESFDQLNVKNNTILNVNDHENVIDDKIADVPMKEENMEHNLKDTDLNNTAGIVLENSGVENIHKSDIVEPIKENIEDYDLLDSNLLNIHEKELGDSSVINKQGNILSEDLHESENEDSSIKTKQENTLIENMHESFIAEKVQECVPGDSVVENVQNIDVVDEVMENKQKCEVAVPIAGHLQETILVDPILKNTQDCESSSIVVNNEEKPLMCPVVENLLESENVDPDKENSQENIIIDQSVEKLPEENASEIDSNIDNLEDGIIVESIEGNEHNILPPDIETLDIQKSPTVDLLLEESQKNIIVDTVEGNLKEITEELPSKACVHEADMVGSELENIQENTIVDSVVEDVEECALLDPFVENLEDGVLVGTILDDTQEIRAEIEENTPEHHFEDGNNKLNHNVVSENDYNPTDTTKSNNLKPKRVLKRSLSESALDTYGSKKVRDDFKQEDTEHVPSWASKRKKVDDSSRNHIRPELIARRLCNVLQHARRNSVSTICNEENVSFCILIDNDCIITEEGEETDKICFAEISEDCLADLQNGQCIDEDKTSELLSENMNVEENQDDFYDHSDSFVKSNDEDHTSNDPWVEDVACVETIENEDIAEDIIISAPTSPIDSSSDEDSNQNDSGIFGNTFNESMEKVKDIYGSTMCGDDAELVEKLYRTPQMDVNKTLFDKESQGLENENICYDDKSLEKILSESNVEDTFETDSVNVVNVLQNSPKLVELPENKENVDDNVFLLDKHKTLTASTYTDAEKNCQSKLTNELGSKAQIDTIHSCESSIDNVLSYNREGTPRYSSSSSPEVSSTTSEEKNSGILLKITNYKGSMISQINNLATENCTKSVSCKFTEDKQYLSKANFHTTPRGLITKAAQKYIPPLKETISDVIVKLPLPPHSLLKLKQLKTSKDTKHGPSLSSHRKTSYKNEIPKKAKPKFEDVLKSIDEQQFQMHKDKRVKKSVPKVVIKKNGSHYTSSSSKDRFNPDLTGRKWQPWVFLEKSRFIDRMAIKNKTKAVYSHRKKTYVIAENFKKYKSVSSSFIISQTKIDETSGGKLKYTIRLKHTY